VRGKTFQEKQQIPFNCSKARPNEKAPSRRSSPNFSNNDFVDWCFLSGVRHPEKVFLGVVVLWPIIPLVQLVTKDDEDSFA